eukprot:223256_1
MMEQWNTNHAHTELSTTHAPFTHEALIRNENTTECKACGCGYETGYNNHLAPTATSHKILLQFHTHGIGNRNIKHATVTTQFIGIKGFHDKRQNAIKCEWFSIIKIIWSYCSGDWMRTLQSVCDATVSGRRSMTK